MKNKVIVALLAYAVFLNEPAFSQPEGGAVILGEGAIVQTPDNTIVNQGSDRLAIDWDSFNLATGQLLEFNQPSSVAIALNRDLSGTRSEIYGDILANGNVFIVNQNGVLFGDTATVNAAGLLVSDLELSMESFSKNQFEFSDASKSAGGITNNGSLYANSINGIHLLGQQIVNNGSIRTDNADIQLTSADSVIVVVDPQTGLGIEMKTPITVPLDADDALIVNTGSIVANGGNIYLNSFVQSGILNEMAVRNSGVVNAVAINEQNGKIFLVEKTQKTTDADQVGKIVEASQAESEASTGEESSGSRVTSFEGNTSSLNQIMPDCDPDKGDKDCKKQNAIKSFLGRMLIGGGLP